MSTAPAITVVVLLAGLVPASRAQAETDALRARGSVELTPVEATHAGEAEAIGVLVDKFGPVWRSGSSWFVPRDRVEENIRTWLRRDFRKLGMIEAEPLEVRKTTAGQAFRQSYQLRFRGDEARKVQLRGESVVSRLNRQFRQRYVAIGAIWVLLLLGCFRLDRATRGYLTGRIRFVSLALAVVTAILIYP